MKFEYYVLNYDFNNKKTGMFNVFNNYLVQERAEDAVKRYLDLGEKYQTRDRRLHTVLNGFDAFCEDIRMIIMCEEWARSQYEIGVGYAFTLELRDVVQGVERGDIPKEELYDYIQTNAKKNFNLEKWDCYQQCLPNIPMICREIIYQYNEQLEEENND